MAVIFDYILGRLRLDDQGIGKGVASDVNTGSTYYFNQYPDTATIDLSGLNAVVSLPDMSANISCTTLILSGTSLTSWAYDLPPNLENFVFSNLGSSGISWPTFPTSIKVINCSPLNTLNAYPSFTGLVNLTDFNISNSATFNAAIGIISDLIMLSNFTATACAISTANVNALLVKLLALANSVTYVGTPGTIDLSGGTSGAPSGAGAAAVISLGLLGWTVLHN